jgi:hypothetical protein
MFTRALLGISLSLAIDARVHADDTRPARPIDERIQIVGTIAQRQSGQTQGVVILRDGDMNRTVFAELGKAFMIDQTAYRIARIDYQGAIITDGRNRFDISYINPPSASAGSEALVYDSEEEQRSDDSSQLAEPAADSDAQESQPTLNSQSSGQPAESQAPAATAAQESYNEESVRPEEGTEVIEDPDAESADPIEGEEAEAQAAEDEYEQQ